MKINVFSAVSTLITCLFFPVSSFAEINGVLSLNDTDWGYELVTDPVRAGEVSQRFEVRDGDCGIDSYSGWSDCDNDRERSEISLNESWTYGEDQWIGYSIFVPERFATSMRVATTVGQVHQRGGPTGTAGGYASQPPVFQLDMKAGEFFLRVHLLSGDENNVTNDVVDFELLPLDEMRGRWTDIAVNFDTSHEGGSLTVYVNGRRLAEYSGWIEFIPNDYFFKYGIYRTFVSRHGAPMPTQVLYIDEVRFGNSLFDVLVSERNPID